MTRRKFIQRQHYKYSPHYRVLKYRAEEGKNGNFILKHSTGAIPHGSEVDVPLIYADYYFLEALLRYNRMINNKPIL